MRSRRAWLVGACVVLGACHSDGGDDAVDSSAVVYDASPSPDDAAADDLAEPSNGCGIPTLTWTPRADWISVKSSPYRAYGDGTHDDTAAIQAAIDATTQGGTVYFPAGTYLVSSTLAMTGYVGTTARFAVSMIGNGAATILKWTGPAGGTLLKVDSNPYALYRGLCLQGQGVAAIGVLHSSQKYFETSISYRDVAFHDFTANGMTQDASSPLLTAETSFENCVFDHCGTGVDATTFNDYDWTIAGCDFIACGYGVHAHHGTFYLRDSYFSGSTVADVWADGPEHGSSVRRCKSVGSNQFIFTGTIGALEVHDNYVSDWTNASYTITNQANGQLGAIQIMAYFGDLSNNLFVNPPNTTQTPVLLWNNLPVVSSNNTSPDFPSVFTAGGKVYDVPAGTITPRIANATTGPAITTFVDTTPQAMTTVFDVAPSGGDDTVHIQAAIDSARTTGHGATVYLERGTYNVSATLHVTGSDYVFAGSGWNTQLSWTGAAGGTMISVLDPVNVRIENMQVGTSGATNNANDIEQTSTAGVASSMVYRRVYVYGTYQNNPSVKGLQLSGLSKTSSVVLDLVAGNIRVLESADATVLGTITYEGAITVDDTTSARTGLLGFLSRLSTNNNFGVIINNSNSITMSDWYTEQTCNGLSLNGAAGNPAGRVSLQLANQDFAMNGCLASPSPVNQSMNIANYNGEVFQGGTQFYTSAVPIEKIVQTGTNPCDITVYAGDFYQANNAYTGPMFSFSGTTGTLSTLCNFTQASQTAPADSYTPTTLMKMSAAFDDHERVGYADIKLNYPFIP